MIVEAVLIVVGCLMVSVALHRTRALQHQGGSRPTRGASVVVPARDEARTLPLLLDSLSAGTAQPTEVIVVDDESTDATAAVARARGATVVDGRPPPPGWLGKPWACTAGAARATTDRLVFVDADVRFDPAGFAAVVAEHDAVGGLLSVQPHHVPGRLVEELSVVFNVCAVAGSGGGRDGGAHVAFGPCLMIDRRDYEHIGGHAVVASSVVEDLDLARAATAEGVGVTTRRGGALVAYRMYPGGWRALVEGWTKNIALGAGRAPIWAVACTAVWIAALGSATVGLLVGLTRWTGGGTPPWAAALAYLAVALHCRWLFSHVGRFRWVTAALFPVPLAVFLGVFLRSLVTRLTRRPVRWRGRRVDHVDPAPVVAER